MPPAVLPTTLLAILLAETCKGLRRFFRTGRQSAPTHEDACQLALVGAGSRTRECPRMSEQPSHTSQAPRRKSAAPANCTGFKHQQFGIGKLIAWSAEPRRGRGDPRRAARAETHGKRPQRPCCCREHMSERPRSRERRRPELCVKPSGQPGSMLRASAVAVRRKRGLAGASDASPWWLGLAEHAGCGSLP